MERPTWEQLLRAIEASIDQQAPVLIVLHGVYSHYTVATGYTPTRLKLFDSAGFAWLNLASCSTRGAEISARHQLGAQSITAIRV